MNISPQSAGVVEEKQDKNTSRIHVEQNQVAIQETHLCLYFFCSCNSACVNNDLHSGVGLYTTSTSLKSLDNTTFDFKQI